MLVWHCTRGSQEVEQREFARDYVAEIRTSSCRIRIICKFRIKPAFTRGADHRCALDEHSGDLPRQFARHVAVTLRASRGVTHPAARTADLPPGVRAAGLILGVEPRNIKFSGRARPALYHASISPRALDRGDIARNGFFQHLLGVFRDDAIEIMTVDACRT